MLYISISSASFQTLFPFFLSSSKACSTLVGISIPYLCVVFLILFLSAARMTCLFYRVWGTHHSNAGSLSIPLALAYSATSTRCDSFISASLIQDSDLSFHLMSSSQPFVVFLMWCLPFLVWTYLSWC